MLTEEQHKTLRQVPAEALIAELFYRFMPDNDTSRTGVVLQGATVQCSTWNFVAHRDPSLHIEPKKATSNASE